MRITAGWFEYAKGAIERANTRKARCSVSSKTGGGLLPIYRLFSINTDAGYTSALFQEQAMKGCDHRTYDDFVKFQCLRVGEGYQTGFYLHLRTCPSRVHQVDLRPVKRL